MAYELHNGIIESLKVGTVVIPPRSAVGLDASAKDRVVPVASNNVEVIGLTGAATAPAGRHVPVYREGNVVKAVAMASLGHGAIIGVASTNGALGPIAGASGVARQRVGIAQEPVAAGEVFSLYVSPRQLGGLA